MTVMRRVRRVLGLPLKAKGLMVETLVLLALARTAVLLLPFRWVARALGREEAAASPLRNTPASTRQVRRIGWMVEKVSNNVPWTSKCLDQALAAKIMLARRGYATTVRFGVKKSEHGELAAHAWLTSAGVCVTGGRTRRQFTIINTFRDGGA